MKYSNYKSADFLKDEYFRSWVINPDEESDFFWSSFLENNSDKYPTLIKAKELILLLTFSTLKEPDLNMEEVDSMLNKVLDEGKKPVRKNRAIQNWTWIFDPNVIPRAAIFLFIITFIAVAWLTNRSSESVEEVSTAKTNIKSTSKGEKMTVRLPDNSMVVLNSGSHLEYPDYFSESERKIVLTGEAFFSVSEDNGRPFIIESDQFVVQVKGTSFAIKKMDDSPAIDVSVVTGKVNVTHVVNEIEMVTIDIEAQQMVSFSSTNKKFEKKELDYNENISWKDGTLYFKNSNFNEIVQRLENWYGVNITINKSLDRKKDFTGHFTNQNLVLVLKGLSFTYDFDYKINGKEIIIN